MPTVLGWRRARRGVAVWLSGDGGDELFGGYQRYAHTANIWKWINRVPGRNLLTQLMVSHVKHSPFPWKRASIGRYAELLGMPSADELYSRLHRHWSPEQLLRGTWTDPSAELGFGQPWPGLNDPQLGWMALDTKTYLAEDILTKLDRTSMAVSLEARVPLLDHQVVEYAWSLPQSFRFEPQQGKKILQSVLARHVPRALFERPKIGFGIPIGEWLRGSLFEWADSLLSEDSLNAHGYFQTDLIRERWDQHVSGVTNWQYPLWDVLMFQAWLAEQKQTA